MTTPLEKLLILFAFCYLNKIASANIDALHKSVVVELDGITFDHLLKNYQHSIVIFYSNKETSVKHKYDDPKFVQSLAFEIKDEFRSVIIGRILREDYEELVAGYNIAEFPALFFINGGKVYRYQGEEDIEKIRDWVVQLIHKKLTIIRNKFMYVKDEFKLLAIYPDDFDYEIFYFEKLMKDGIFFDNNIICVGLASHPSYIELEGVGTPNAPSLFLIRRTADGETSTVEFKGNHKSFEEVAKFVNINSFPLVVNFTRECSERLFLGYIDTLFFLFIDPVEKDSQSTKQALAVYHNHAENNSKADFNRNGIVHLIIEYSEKYKDIQVMFNLHSSTHLPALFLAKIHPERHDLAKYQSNKKEINEENINEFFQDSSENKLNKLLISEPVPTRQEFVNLHRIVGSSFDDLVIKSEDSCLVLFCDDFEQHYCAFPLLVLKFFAKLAKDKDIRITLGYFDASKNEIDNFYLSSFPSFYLFKKDQKSKPIALEGGYSLYLLSYWLRDHSVTHKNYVTDEDNQEFIKTLTDDRQKEEYKNMRVISSEIDEKSRPIHKRKNSAGAYNNEL